jgi:hypothetical protein
MTLAAVTKGRIERPMRVLLFGTEGLGKSTFGANAPAPIFLASEDGTSQLDVARFPEPKTWRDAFAAVDALTNEEHAYQTLVIDTLDWLEPLCWAAVCERPDDKGRKRDSIEDFGFGKGYVAALDEWRVLLARIERMRLARNMHVVMLAHSWVKPFKNPEGDDYDRYEMKLHAKAGGLLKEWCDVVLFGAYETFANTDKTTKRTRGVSTGARVVHTQRTAAWDAKNRYDLPETLPLDWEAFHAAVKAHAPADPAKLRERIVRLLDGQGDDLASRVHAAITKAGDNAAQLARIADKLAADIGIQNQESGR